MTTGNVVQNQLHTVIGPYGAVTGGVYRQKTWTGGDSAPRRKVIYQKMFRWDTVIVKKLIYIRRLKIHRVVEVEKKVLRYMKVAEPKPPRSRLSPNHYSCNIVYKVDPVVTVGPSYKGTGNTFPATLAWWAGGTGFTMGLTSDDTYRLYGKVRDALVGSDFNAGVFLAEASPALGMIFNAATRIDRALRRVQKGDFQGASRALIDGPMPKGRKFSAKKSTSSNWLELQYGWLPLLKDAEGGARFLAHLSSVPLSKRVVVRTSRVSTQDGLSRPGAYRYANWDERLSMQIVCYLDEVDVVGLSGLTDVASIVWERIPYSFVVDWFLPIGNFLQARGLAQNVKGTFVQTVSRRLKASGFGYDPVYLSTLTDNQLRDTTVINGLAGATVHSVSIERTILSSLSTPLPQVKGVGEAMSWRRTANAVALLTQRLFNSPLKKERATNGRNLERNRLRRREYTNFTHLRPNERIER